MKGLHFPLGLAQFGGRREGLTDGLAVDLARQTEVGAVSGLVGLMTMAVGFSAAAVDGGDGATAKIAQLQKLGQDAGTLLFQGGEGLGQRAPPILTYLYVRIIPAKKENCQILLSVSRTPPQTIPFHPLCYSRFGGSPDADDRTPGTHFHKRSHSNESSSAS